MQMIDRQRIQELRALYTPGTWIRLIHMDDMQAPPDGTLGTVKWVDDAGTIHMRWNNGSSLGLIVEKDEFELLNRPQAIN